MNEDEKKYEDVIGTLKTLQQVKAHPNFETDLKRRLNEEKYAGGRRKGLRKYFMPSRLIPSFGLVAAAVIIFMIVNINSDEADNPFLMEPKVREDMILISETDEVPVPEDNLTSEPDVTIKERVEDESSKGEGMDRMMEETVPDEDFIAETEISPAETTITGDTGIVETGDYSSPPATGFAIKKSALNFRQVNITKEQQKEIIELKKRISTEQEKADIK